MSERVQVIFRWDREKLEQLKAWAQVERFTLQEVLEALATKFLDSPDSTLITEDNNFLSTDSGVLAEVIARLTQVEKTVNHLAPIQERVTTLENELVSQEHLLGKSPA